MSKRYKNLLIGSIALMVLVIALVALTLLSAPDEVDLDSSSETSSASLALIAQEVDDVSVIEITNESGSFTVERIGTEKWQIAALADYPSDEEALASVAGSAASITAVKLVEEGADLAKYGLDAPQASVRVQFKDVDSSEYAFRIGDATPTGGQYYFCMEGENTVYTVTQSVLNDFLDGENVYIDTALVPSYEADAMPQIDEVRIERADLEKPIDLVAKLGEEDTTGAFSNHAMVSPVNAMLDVTKSADALEGLFGLTADEAILPGPDAEALTQYGLNEPFCTVTLTSGQQVYKLILGNEVTEVAEAEEGQPALSTTVGYYAMLDGIDVIYSIGLDALPWVAVQPMDIISRLVVLPYIYDVNYALIEMDGESWQFDCIGDEEEFSFAYQGQTLDSDNFKQFYQYMLRGVIEDINTSPNESEPLCTITYVYDDTTKQSDVVRYYAYNDRYIQISVNDDMRFIASKTYLSRLKENIGHVINGEEINMSW